MSNSRQFDDDPEPKFSMRVRGDVGAWDFAITWQISPNDASMWEYPLGISISPIPKYSMTEEEKSAWDAEVWETVFDISREQMRLLRDALDAFLRSPDLRQNAEGVWIRGGPDEPPCP